MDYNAASEAVSKLTRMLKPLEDAAEMLAKMGSLEQASAEVAQRTAQSVKQAKQADEVLAATNGQISKATEKASEIIKSAKAQAQQIIDQANAQATQIVEHAKAQGSAAIDAANADIADRQAKAAQKLKDVSDQIDAKTQEHESLNRKLAQASAVLK